MSYVTFRRPLLLIARCVVALVLETTVRDGARSLQLFPVLGPSALLSVCNAMLFTLGNTAACAVFTTICTVYCVWASVFPARACIISMSLVRGMRKAGCNDGPAGLTDGWPNCCSCDGPGIPRTIVSASVSLGTCCCCSTHSLCIFSR